MSERTVADALSHAALVEMRCKWPLGDGACPAIEPDESRWCIVCKSRRALKSRMGADLVVLADEVLRLRAELAENAGRLPLVGKISNDDWHRSIGSKEWCCECNRYHFQGQHVRIY